MTTHFHSGSDAKSSRAVRDPLFGQYLSALGSFPALSDFFSRPLLHQAHVLLDRLEDEIACLAT
ncbi:hypothetical protein, partial [Mesorhizobium sp. M2D.F.Ca.ET.223.01.1.1]|uniref:hypothetical protein n=1 Tax=Mesorhizobium sp. M2D.F.Ca.ET.223.01.1.1 TaxID=2563940 RepID=UPI001AED26A1